MSGADLAQWVATILVGIVGSSAAWGYLKDRRKARAEGDVATQTVEIEVEARRVANLEQRFGFAQRAWDDERESMTRRIVSLERDLAAERRDRAGDEQRHEEAVRRIRDRVASLTDELAAVTAELSTIREGRETTG